MLSLKNILRISALGFVAVIAMVTSFSSHAANVQWSLTFDSVINNPNGSWGGDINLGAGQNTNISLLMEYEELPFFTIQAGNFALFKLVQFQILDNTNGLSSAIIAADEFTERGFTYNQFGTLDHNSETAVGSVGASFNIDSIPLADLGNVGDPYPFGPTLDAAVNASELSFVIARAPTSGDNIFGINGADLSPGSFIFSSTSLVPLPAAWLFFVSALAGIRLLARSRNRT